jgi:photosystem II Psb27 protein
MFLKSILNCLFALILVVVIGFTGSASASAAGLGGNYQQDTLSVIETLTTVLTSPSDAPDLPELQNQARKEISDYISRYRRNTKSGGLKSFTTMQTALNSLAGYYTAYGSRPVPEKLKTRVQMELKQAEVAVKRGV